MTPAEKLSAEKGATLRPRLRRDPVWACAVRTVRTALGLTLHEAARGSGVSVAALWQIERGIDPQLTTARRLAEFFGKPVEELWPARATKAAAEERP